MTPDTSEIPATGKPACPATAPEAPAIPPTPAGQAAYMRAIAQMLDSWDRAPSRISPALLADIVRAVAVIGEATATAQMAYAAGLRDGARARETARRATAARKEMQG